MNVRRNLLTAAGALGLIIAPTAAFALCTPNTPAPIVVERAERAPAADPLADLPQTVPTVTANPRPVNPAPVAACN